MMEFILNVLRGAVIGVANVIPGVSGGTMAVVMNIYDRLIGAVSRLRKELRQNFFFLLAVGLGAVAGIFLFGSLVKYLLGEFPMAVNFFFLGLILGSVPMIFRRATAGGFHPLHLLPFLIAVGVMLAMTFLSPPQSGAVVTQLSVGVFFQLLITSAIAAVAMILPGVSGSMMLMIFGVYFTVITAVSDLNFLMLIPVAIGVLIGIFWGAKMIDVCLRKFPQATFWVVLGLVAGSLVSVYRNAGFSFSWEGLIAILLLIAGVAVALLFSSEKLGKKDRGNAEISAEPDLMSSESMESDEESE